MNKVFLFISILSITSLASSQTISQGNETSIYVGENSILTFENALFNGALLNDGDLFINQSVDFFNNKEVGKVTFLGSLPSVVSGTKLNFQSLTANTSSNIILTSDSIFTKALDLNDGVIVTGFTHFKTLDEISGGSNQSYIDGTLIIEKRSDGLQNFPIGRDGLYNPITLSLVPANSVTSASVNIPDETKLMPNDSIIGLNKQFEWEINYLGSQSTSTPIIQFQGIDLNDLPNRIEIKAPIYVPVIAQYDNTTKVYRTLGIGSIEDTDNITFGTIESASSFILNQSPIFLTIGLAPTTNKLHFYVPNFFSPDAQLEENRIFRPFLVGEKVTELSMKVWDQYNRPVFNENYSHPNMNLIGWTGDDEPEGVYFYTIELKSDGGIFEKQGTVFLAR